VLTGTFGTDELLLLHAAIVEAASATAATRLTWRPKQ
jgi:hypothetical protein